MPLNAGTNYNPADFTPSTNNWASMAAAMEYAFKIEWPKVMGDAPAPEKPEELNQMRLLFAAIAQGVVKYLQEHATDFKVTVTDTGTGTDTGTVTQID